MPIRSRRSSPTARSRLVTVRAADDRAASVQQILDTNAVDTAERGALYRSEGWSRFDEAAPAYRSDLPGGRAPLV